MADPNRSVLYITYDGLTDPLGRSQVLPYLTGLAARGWKITILSCEKPARLEKDGAAVQLLCARAGLDWQPLTYHKWPPVLSSAYDGERLKRSAMRLHRQRNFALVHCRSYIPAAAGLALKQRRGVPLLFDMRGFWPDEKVEGNSWNLDKSLFRMVYRHFKTLEARLLTEADHIISLTHEGKSQLLTRPQLAGADDRITVIPCCVDFDHFPMIDQATRKSARSTLSISAEARVLAYLGSIGAWYLLDEMLDFFRVYAGRHPRARFLFVTHDDPALIRAAASRRGVDPGMLVIVPGSREQVPRLMAAADLGIFFIAPVFSKTASSPTKMGEMLALGLPLVANAGVGDVARIIAETRCGVAVERFDDAAYEQAIDQAEALETGREERRRAALPWFDVELGIERYDRVYRDLAGQAKARK